MSQQAGPASRYAAAGKLSPKPRKKAKQVLCMGII
jgi:hypothetical protein